MAIHKEPIEDLDAQSDRSLRWWRTWQLETFVGFRLKFCAF